MACPQPLQDIATLMLESGMRPKEIYKLTRRRVNLLRGCVQVSEGKTESSNRLVWLTDKAINIVKHRMDALKGEYLFPMGNVDGAGPYYSLNAVHRKARTDAKLPEFRLYDCRHTFATRAVEDGMDLVTLAAILGHASLHQLQRYAHPSEDHKRTAIRGMDKSAKAIG